MVTQATNRVNCCISPAHTSLQNSSSTPNHRIWCADSVLESHKRFVCNTNVTVKGSYKGFITTRANSMMYHARKLYQFLNILQQITFLLNHLLYL